MEWIDAKSLEELKLMGNFREVKKKISKDFDNQLKISARSWKDLFNLVTQLRKFKNEKKENSEAQYFLGNRERESNYIKLDYIDNVITGSDGVEISYVIGEKTIIQEKKNLFFHDKAAEYIFYLTKLDGESRQKMLDITKFHYNDRGYAQKWYRNIAKVIDPDVCKHPYSKKASIELNKMYERMQDNGQEKYRNRTSS
ncbi:hypothetical protein [Priestia megaterium]|uniref:hypothetical protein n=1 Tax=Priestia megaterium TaxID=1404 RepID=UPI0034585F83